MNKKRKAKTTKDNIINILDKNYFHVSIVYDTKDNKEQWTVFYKNLPENVYFSNNNKAVLNSKYNTLEDVYALDREFRKAKQKEINKNFFELANIIRIISNLYMEVKEIYMDTFYFFAIAIAILTVLNAFINGSSLVSTSNFLIFSSYSILLLVGLKRLKHKFGEATDEIIEKTIKEKIKRRGLFFIKEIKSNFEVEREVKKDATNKKARKTIK